MPADIYHHRTLRLPENCPVALFPSEVSGNQERVWTNDDATHALLEMILIELRKVNTQLALMNDTVLNTGDSL